MKGIFNLIKKNKYLIAIVIFMVWMVLFDRSSVQKHMSKNRELRDLKRQEQYFIKDIEQNREKLEELKGNAEALERFAREQYYMKKKNQDVFIIEENLDE